MHSERIHDAKSPWGDAFWAAYEASFPADERRTPASQAAALADSRYRLDAWTDNGTFIGFMAWWDFGAYRYIEHIAIAPEARSGGYGKRVLQTWMGQADTPVYLEIEKVVDEHTRRRLAFYTRLGFLETPMEHEQPPYQGAGRPVPMQTLSWPEQMTPAQYTDFFRTLHTVVWAKLHV